LTPFCLNRAHCIPSGHYDALKKIVNRLSCPALSICIGLVRAASIALRYPSGRGGEGAMATPRRPTRHAPRTRHKTLSIVVLIEQSGSPFERECVACFAFGARVKNEAALLVICPSQRRASSSAPAPSSPSASMASACARPPRRRPPRPRGLPAPAPRQTLQVRTAQDVLERRIICPSCRSLQLSL
jgi:hypothetical protein